MSRLEHLADDVTPARLSVHRTRTSLSSPLRTEATLPRLDLSPESPIPAAQRKGREGEGMSESRRQAAQEERFCQKCADAKQLESQNAELSELVVALEADQQKLMRHHTILKATIDEMHTELAEERKRSAELMGRVRAIDEEWKGALLSVESLNRDRETSQQEHRALSAALDEARQHASAESAARFSAEEARSKLEVELEAAHRRLSEHRKRFDEQTAVLNAEISHEKKLCTEAVSRTCDLEDRLGQRTEQLETTRAELGEARDRAQRQTDELRKRASNAQQLAKQLEAVKAQLTESMNEVDKKYQQLHDVAGDIVVLGDRLKLLDPDAFSGFLPNANPRSQLKSMSRGVEALIKARVADRKELCAKRKQVAELETARRVAADAQEATASKLEDALRRLKDAETKLQAASARAVSDENDHRQRCALQDSLLQEQRTVEDLRFRLTEMQVAAQSDKSVVASQAKQIEVLAAEAAACRASLADAESKLEASADIVAKAKRRESKAHAAAKHAEDQVTTLTAQVQKLETALKHAQAEASRRRQRSPSPKAPLAPVCVNREGSIEAEVKRFVTRHGAPDGLSVADSLNHISATLCAESRELAALRREIHQERERGLFLEAELSAIRSTSPQSGTPPSGGRRTLPTPMATSPGVAIDSRLKPCLL
uniref:Uncharacterized protein n=1 Tax=Neobodo designis TaxID=312471 RepID=A0A7S1M7G1_NEODS